MAWLDRFVLDLLAPLAFWLLLNGLDDLFLDVVRYRATRRGGPPAPPGPASSAPLALLIPCWQEAEVIESMLERNLAVLDGDNFDVWLGLYPNDPDSLERVRAVAARHDNVRWVVGPHDGPTTKADCLNHLLAGILAEERRSGERYEIFLLHDAEDLLDPRELDMARRWTRRYGMAQFPVFPLQTPLGELTHGVYCDEFVEAHLRDLPARSWLGGFIPSAGVATAIRRAALDQLRITYGNQPFDPRCLTEDYCLGRRIQDFGFEQAFVAEVDPACVESGGYVASRAYFPRTFRAAVRQRTRWSIGNVLQAWELFGWGRSAAEAYWFWRDRKGLLNHPLALASNLLFVAGLAGWVGDAARGREWAIGAEVAATPWLLWALTANAALLLWRQGVRAWWSSRVYGWKFAVGVPVRALWANLVNAVAAVRAVWIFFAAKVSGRPLVWAKTQHAYPVSEVSPERVSQTAAAGR